MKGPTVSHPPPTAPKPPTRNAWKGLAGMDGATAMQRYVDRVAEWFPPLPSGSGEATLAASGGGGGGGGSGGSRGGGGGDLSLGSASISTMGAIGLDGRCVLTG